MSACACVCISVRLDASVSICHFVCKSARPYSMSSHLHISVGRSVICVLLCLYACASVRPYIGLSSHLSVFTSVLPLCSPWISGTEATPKVLEDFASSSTGSLKGGNPNNRFGPSIMQEPNLNKMHGSAFICQNPKWVFNQPKELRQYVCCSIA